MENTGYIALSQQMALQKKMDVVANNIANMDTSGYQGQHMMFTEHVMRADKKAPISMVMDYGTYRNTAQGSLTETGNPMDVALSGPGFLMVQGLDGSQQYTRNGRFQLNERRELVTSFGQPVLDAGGKVIAMPQGQNQMFVTSTGAVSTEAGEIGQLGIMRFANTQGMQSMGNGLYTSTQTAIPDETTQVMQGMVESSNVNPIIEMTNMIEVSRAYQSTARLLQTDHDRQRDAIRKLAQA